MQDLQAEQEFFHEIAKKVLDFVTSKREDTGIAEHKKVGDFSTHVDVGVENLIVEEIKKRFSTDLVLAEEGHSDVQIPEGRIWIIDPICGTNNLARGIRNFCTNIALADNGKLIASCVVDHSHNEYYWSVGEKKVYKNNALIEQIEERFDTVLEVDLGAAGSTDAAVQARHNKFLRTMIGEKGFRLISLNTSLGFAYTAIGKVDGILNVYNHPWDICAASFLIQQSGGVITDLEGAEWTVTSVGAIAAKNKELHQKILSTFLNF